MNNDRIWVLFGKQASGEISPKELLELESLLKEHPEEIASPGMVEAIWHTPLQETAASANSKTRIWDQVSPALTSAPHRSMIRRIATVAAAATLLAAAWALWQFARPATPVLQQLSSAPGGKSKVILPDSSIVWLNHGTQLNYEKNNFGKHHREVTLTGEAFFDIAKNEALPFIIHAGKVNIRVLGTAFNVKAYTGDSTIATTLVCGKIAVSFREQTVVLQPKEELIIPLTGTTRVFQQQHLEKDSTGYLPGTSWLNNKLAFDNETFGELAVKMYNWYGVTFHFESPGLEQLRFSGIIDTESIEEALKMLQLSRPFNFRVNGKEILVSN
ncbi:FecR family protein [Chitinophaga sp.]|uniref:FecR family protein n=1 Tax=Chitinophaga sp. TaxID=1869181 RepID=UPI002BA759AF|nr:FecR family protein [Chitinophaga sp.]HWV66117.1 FecR family protein [Chitinophaga sp.]